MLEEREGEILAAMLVVVITILLSLSLRKHTKKVVKLEGVATEETEEVTEDEYVSSSYYPHRSSQLYTIFESDESIGMSTMFTDNSTSNVRNDTEVAEEVLSSSTDSTTDKELSSGSDGIAQKKPFSSASVVSEETPSSSSNGIAEKKPSSSVSVTAEKEPSSSVSVTAEKKPSSSSVGTAEGELSPSGGGGAEEELSSSVGGTVEEEQASIDGGTTKIKQSSSAGGGCIVCGIPTSTRCKRCKLVKYCSRACQIQHWREGHKLECVEWTSLNDSTTVSMLLSKDKCEDEEEDRQCFSEEKLYESETKICSEENLRNTGNEEGRTGGGKLGQESTERKHFSQVAAKGSSHVETSSSPTEIKTMHAVVAASSETIKDHLVSTKEKLVKGAGEQLTEYSNNGNFFTKRRVATAANTLKKMMPEATASSSGGITSHPNSKILFPYNDFVQLFKRDLQPLLPCGLNNSGNSCFANVVLQCLTYTRPLAAYLLQQGHSKQCRQRDWCFMCELQNHVIKVRERQKAFSPISILSHIPKIGNHLDYGRQQDAHEFMRFAIDSMQSICLDGMGGEKSADPCTLKTTLVHHIFGGNFQSQVKCLQCHLVSSRFDDMMDLAVEINGNVGSLEDALAQFTAPELLDGENKYKCDRCNAYVKAWKQLRIYEAPNILMITLKRFQAQYSARQAGKFGKLNKNVTFPESLDIMPYMSGKGDNPPSYELYGVVVHLDTWDDSFSGHYICFVKDFHGNWYQIDDSQVLVVGLEKVLQQSAYMLLYKRSSPRPEALTQSRINGKERRTSSRNHDSMKSQFAELSRNGVGGRYGENNTNAAELWESISHVGGRISSSSSSCASLESSFVRSKTGTADMLAATDQDSKFGNFTRYLHLNEHQGTASVISHGGEDSLGFEWER